MNFTIFKGKGKECRILVTSKDTIEFVSRFCDCRTEAVSLIRQIRKNAQCHDAYKIKMLDCGSYRFELYDMTTNQILGESATQINLKDLELKIQQMHVLVPTAKFMSDTDVVNY